MLNEALKRGFGPGLFDAIGRSKLESIRRSAILHFFPFNACQIMLVLPEARLQLRSRHTRITMHIHPFTWKSEQP